MGVNSHKPIAAAVTLLLSACVSTPDGTTRTIEWIRYDDPVALNKACDKSIRSKRMSPAVWGCYNNIGGVCVVRTLAAQQDPRIHDTLGHEVRHCFEGQFHD